LHHRTVRRKILVVFILACTLLGSIAATTAAAAPAPRAVAQSTAAFPRPTAVTDISAPTTCHWAEGLLVTFDTGEVVCVGLGFNARPALGTVDSFWRAYWSLEFPFYYSAGFTQNGTPDRILFTEM
jgi:hypothetical protein